MGYNDLLLIPAGATNILINEASIFPLQNLGIPPVIPLVSLDPIFWSRGGDFNKWLENERIRGLSFDMVINKLLSPEINSNSAFI